MLMIMSSDMAIDWLLVYSLNTINILVIVVKSSRHQGSGRQQPLLDKMTTTRIR